MGAGGSVEVPSAYMWGGARGEMAAERRRKKEGREGIGAGGGRG